MNSNYSSISIHSSSFDSLLNDYELNDIIWFFKYNLCSYYYKVNIKEYYLVMESENALEILKILSEFKNHEPKIKIFILNLNSVDYDSKLLEIAKACEAKTIHFSNIESLNEFISEDLDFTINKSNVKNIFHLQ